MVNRWGFRLHLPRTHEPVTSHWISPFRIHTRSLAVFRIAVALVLAWDVLVRLGDLTAFYLPGGAVSSDVVRQSQQGSWIWSINLWVEGSTWQLMLWALRLLATLALLLGFHCRAAAIVAWLLTVSLHSSTPMLVTGGDVLLAMMLFWSTLLPIGCRISLDARQGRATVSQEWIEGWATRGVILQLVVMYLFTGWVKCNPTWFSGDAIQLALADGALTRPAGQLMLLMPGLLKLLSWSTPVLEFLCPALLLWPGRARWPRTVGVLGLCALHVGIELSMNVLIFSFASLAALVILTPGHWWNRLAGKVERQRAASHAWKEKRLESVIAIVCLTVTLVSNALTVLYRQSAPGWTRHVQRIVNVSHWNQRWNMFEDPETLNYRFLLRGRLASGQVIDLGRGVELSSHEQPARPARPMRFATSRRVLAFRELCRPTSIVFRPQMARWLTERWNQEHAVTEKLMELEWYLFVGSGRDGPVPAQLLFFFDARASGTYLAGQRHGPWILRDDAGQKIAQGDYLHGREDGLWVYWDERAERTAAGRFEKGLRQGEWTYYFQSREPRNVYYRDDVEVNAAEVP